MGRFFGTDGFRGEAGVKLTAELAYKTGRFLGYHYRQKKNDKSNGNDGSRCRIVIGGDTRRSGAMIEAALTAGITASGADVYLMHVTTTPSVSYIARTEGFDCGVMISASHNPYYDNGIKVISGNGSKLGDEEIAEVESYLDGSAGEIPYALKEEIGTVFDYSEGREHYRDFLISVAVKDAKEAAEANDSKETAEAAAAKGSKEANEAIGAADLKYSENADDSKNAYTQAFAGKNTAGPAEHCILSDSDREFAKTIFADRKIALDCADGSASFLAGEVFEALGADAVVMADKPDGININENVGSTHIEALCAFTKEHGCEIGFAYDGDADRCLAADENGMPVNGDQLIYANALSMKKKNKLKKNTVVLTVMSNFGAFKALGREGIDFEKTAVGDRFVWECMSENGFAIGGEQSGHIIFADDATTGDGILTSIKTMQVLKESGKKASELFEGCEMYPQSLKNVRVGDKKAAVSDESVLEAVRNAEKELGDTGRILLRESGTEPVVRVMAEAGTKEECEKHCDNIIAAMKKAGLTL